jgi:hypothetical protein
MFDVAITVIAYTVNIAVSVITDGACKTAGNSIAHYYWRITDTRRSLSGTWQPSTAWAGAQLSPKP